MSSFTTRLEVTPLDDGRRWRLIRTFKYYEGSDCYGLRISVPSGFVTDFASSPRLLWPIVSPWGKWGKAAVLHDYLYQNKGHWDWRPWGEPNHESFIPCCREYADYIFLEAMEVLGVAPWRRKLMYWGVRLFGWLAWK